MVLLLQAQRELLFYGFGCSFLFLMGSCMIVQENYTVVSKYSISELFILVIFSVSEDVQWSQE